MKIAVVFFLGLLLAACDPTPEEIAKVRAALPPGCTVNDLGGYGEVRHLVVVRRDGRRTTTQISNRNPASRRMAWRSLK